MSHCPSQSTESSNAEEIDDHDCDEIMKGAIRDSIETVLGKDAQDMISSVQEKLVQASEALESVKKTMGRMKSQRNLSK